MANFLISSPKKKFLAAAVVTLAAMVLTVVLEVTGLVSPYRLKTLDLLFRHVPLPKASPQVVVVTVDQPDLDFFKDQGVTWPWPRQLYAPIIDFCRRGKARAVVFDILFTEASSYGAEDDQRLAQAVAAAGNVVLPFFLSRAEKGPNPTEADLLAKAGLTIDGPPPADLPQYRSLLSPIPPLLASAQALGNVESRPDGDGIYRRVPLVVPFKDRWLPILAFAAFHRFNTPGPLRFEEGALILNNQRLPLVDQGQFLLKYRGPSRSHQRFAAANMIKSEYQISHGLTPVYSPEVVADKWVLIGLTAPGLLDLKASPVASVYAGVEIHATLLDNLLQGDFLQTVPPWLWWAWTVALTGGMILVVLFSPTLTGVLGGLVVFSLVNLGLGIFAFMAGWYLDPVLPDEALFMGFALATAYSYATEGRQKKAIRGMFGQYMSETVINHLLAHPEKLKLGGERRRVTLFFSDLAGFTTLSERLEAETVVSVLNDYLSRMTEIILDETGTVDKFEGDAIMAFWGAPLDQEDQAIRACRAALAQQAALTDLNRSFADQNLPTLKMRIGLHTGDAIVGNLGSQKRFDYTVIGDTVNLASRLEGLNKFYGTAIMASEATVQECGDEMAFRELDLVAVKGRETPVRVFEVMALKEELAPAMAARREKFSQGLNLYRLGQFSEAATAFAAALELAPQDGPSQAFLNRCQMLQAAPPPADWDTVFRPDAK
ncbi:MAG: adenylate/guanylate cyclase domain-containing protein [Desulfobaccales bacterium]|nr:adenylate/guanylate cyclase domain-containing protein [Desulfobaccales bacterium]